MSCCVRTCKKNKSVDTLFHFPVDEKLQKIWVDILRENNVVDSDWVLTQDSQICINHFNNSYCIKTENDVLLTGEAYPTMFEVDEYLIEEIYEEDGDGHESVGVTYINEEGGVTYVENVNSGNITYEEVITNGEEDGNENVMNISMQEEILGTNDVDNSFQHVGEDDEGKEQQDIKNQFSKLKNVSITNKINKTLNEENRTPIISKKNKINTKLNDVKKSDTDVETQQIEGLNQNLPTFKVVDGQLVRDEQPTNINNSPKKTINNTKTTSSSTTVTAVPNAPNVKNTIGKSLKEITSMSSGKNAMQAIQIGSQYYLVSPNTPDGKELTSSQLAAIKEKLISEMNTKKSTSQGPHVIQTNNLNKKKPIVIGANTTPMKKQTNNLKQSTMMTPTPKIQQKNVTTIDLNKGLPSNLKNIIKDNNSTRKRKANEELEESETFTVSSSLDIMPVSNKKAKEDFEDSGSHINSGSKKLNSINCANFPGHINSNSNLLPAIILDEISENTNKLAEITSNKNVFFKLLQDVNKNMPPLNKNNWSHIYNQNYLSIIKTYIEETTGIPKQFLCIHINDKLECCIYKNNVNLTKQELLDLNISFDKTNIINTWVQIKAIIDKLNLLKPIGENVTYEYNIVNSHLLYDNYIDKIISTCKNIVHYDHLGVQEHDEKIILFLNEQISLLNENREFRSFSINLITFCYVLYTHSPNLYLLMKKILILPDEIYLKEISNVDISKDFVHINEHRLNRLSNKINGFNKKDKIVILHVLTTKINNSNSIHNIISYSISSVNKHYQDVIYFCSTTDLIPISKIVFLTLEIIKKLETLVGLQVTSIISEYNIFSFELYKKLGLRSSNNKLIFSDDKSVFVNHPVEKKRKLFLIYDSLSILVGIVWDWMCKDYYIYPQFLSIYAKNIMNLKASFLHVISYFKKNPNIYQEHFSSCHMKTMKLFNSIINKENIHISEQEKILFVLSFMKNDIISLFESHMNKDYKQTGQFLRIILDWWNITNGFKTSTSSFKHRSGFNKKEDKNNHLSYVSSTNKESIVKLGSILKWLNLWSELDKNKSNSSSAGNKYCLSTSLIYVWSENLCSYKLLCEHLLREYGLEQYSIGNFQIHQNCCYTNMISTLNSNQSTSSSSSALNMFTQMKFVR